MTALLSEDSPIRRPLNFTASIGKTSLSLMRIPKVKEA